MIDVEPAFAKALYGTAISSDYPVFTRIPEGVTLKYWTYLTGTGAKEFIVGNEEGKTPADATIITDELPLNTTPGEESLDIYAEWIDHNKPSVELTRINFRTLSFHLEDNVGLTDYAVTKADVHDPDDNPVPPADDKWISLEHEGIRPSVYDGTFDIVTWNESDYFEDKRFPSRYYIWTRDKYGNLA